MTGCKWLAVTGLPCLVAAGLLGCGGDDPLAPRIPASIVVVPNAPSIPQLATRQLTATVVDAAGREIEGETVGFSSGDTTIVTVSETGLLTSVGPLGDAVITANDGELTASITVTVTLHPTAIIVTPNPIVLNRTLGTSLSVVVIDGNGDTIPSPTVTFASSVIALVTVNGFGVVQSVGPVGSTKITVSSGDLSVEVPVTVTQIPTALTLDATSIVLAPGEEHVIIATVTDLAGLPIAGSAFTYSSDNPSVLAVDATGLITTGSSTGSGIVTVGSGQLTATMGVFVGSAPPGTVIATVPTGGTAWGVTVTPAGKYYVTLVEGAIVGGAFPSQAFTSSVPTNAQATAIAVNAAGTRGYVAYSQSGSDIGIGVLNLNNSTLLEVIPIAGDTPLAVALSPDGNSLFVGTGTELQVVDVPSKTVVARFAVGGINEITHHPTQPLLYGSIYGGAVVEIDATTRAITRTFAIGGTVQGTAVSLDGTELYVTLEFSNELRVWDLVTNQLKRTIQGAGGFGLGLSPDGEFLYVVSGNVRIFDRASGVLVRTVTTGGAPRRVGFDPATGTAIVTNEQGWVDFID